MSILDTYGIQEVCDVTFYKIDEDGNPTVPALYLDTLKISTLEQTAENTQAVGGKGNAPLIQWDFGKEITFNVQDALFSMKSLATMYGGEIGNVPITEIVTKAGRWKAASLIMRTETFAPSINTSVVDIEDDPAWDPYIQLEGKRSEKINPTFFDDYGDKVEVLSKDEKYFCTFDIDILTDESYMGTMEDTVTFSGQTSIDLNTIKSLGWENYTIDENGNMLFKVFPRLDVEEATHYGVLIGDVNGDGQIDTIDLTTLRQYLADASTEFIKEIQITNIPKIFSVPLDGDVTITSQLVKPFKNIIDITADTFPGTYYVVGDTLARGSENGEDEMFQIVIPKAKIMVDNTLTLEAGGDSSVFDFNMRVLKPGRGQPMVRLVRYDVSGNDVEKNMTLVHNHILEPNTEG